ncbi:MAG TPA: flagellar hook-associated protein FlgK [Noviherbaspirillum sp.]|nr:flagellar hook-associated protein FlgK [Noviherbaspirillum sp.]
MGSSILGVGQSALNAAQMGLTTTGHNIANVNTPGYSRQVLSQGAALPQDIGVGFVGKGTEVTTIRRVFNEFVHGQVLASQTSSNAVESYFAQMKQIDNMLADQTVGVSTVMQDFFNGVQDVAANPNAAASRQAMLSSAQAMAARFQSLSGRLDELRQGVNGQITTSIGVINSYAEQIVALNDLIEKAQGTAGEGKPANDLLDQRDQLIADLSKEIKVSVVKQNNSYNVFIGTGQALVVGGSSFKLTATTSPTDASKIQIGYVSNGTTTTLPDSGLTGGKLGGYLQFRNNSLDPAINQMGRVAIGLATTFNAQHQLGQDQNGALGSAFFTVATPVVNASSANTGAATVAATISNVSQLTTSDYRVQRINGVGGVGVDYVVTRISDGQQTTFAAFPQTIDGLSITASAALTNGDEYLIRPTVDGASKFGVAINDIAKIAAAAPLRTSVQPTNTGTATISQATVSSSVLLKPTQLSLTHNGVVAPGGVLSGFPAGSNISVTSGGVTTTYPAGTATVTYNAGDTLTIDGVNLSVPTTAGAHTIARPTATLTYNGGNLTGFPPDVDIKVTHSDGTVTNYTSVTAATTVAYQSGDTFSFGGVSFSISGTPANNDKFVVGANTTGVGDNRNALLLGSLQTKNTLAGGSTTFQGAYAQMVSQIGNKTHELEISSKAETKMLEQAIQAQQSESGVNLDEEAANLMRYQQAYQAAAKVMQTAGQLFELLLDLGQ